MEGPRLGVWSELQPPASTTAPAPQDPSRVRDLHPSTRHRRILNLQSEARDRTHVLTDRSDLLAPEPQQELLVFSSFKKPFFCVLSLIRTS